MAKRTAQKYGLKLEREMDYKQLLLKYINLVGQQEGVTFINWASPPDFTEEEITELNRLNSVEIINQKE